MSTAGKPLMILNLNHNFLRVLALNGIFKGPVIINGGAGAEDIKGGSPIIFLPRWGGQIKNQTARGGA